MINLFVCILKHPSRASAASDLGLLQMGAGYFGYLEYATASLRCFPFAGDIAKLAQKAMEKVQESHGSGSQSLPASTICLENGGDELMNQYSWDEVRTFFLHAPNTLPGLLLTNNAVSTRRKLEGST